MGFLAYIIVGGIAGWLASIIMNKNAQMGIFANIIVGVIGANIGGFVMRFFGRSGVTGINAYSICFGICYIIIHRSFDRKKKISVYTDAKDIIDESGAFYENDSRSWKSGKKI